jgi:hypothetical protein
MLHFSFRAANSTEFTVRDQPGLGFPIRERAGIPQPILVALLVATLLGIAVAYNLIAHLRLSRYLHENVALDALLVVGVLGVSIMAARNLQLAALSLPVSATLLSAPQIPHLPFIREFGAVVLIGLAMRLAWNELFAGTTTIRTALSLIARDSILIAGILFVATSAVPLLHSALSGNGDAAKVIASHMVVDGLAWFTVLLVSIGVHRHGPLMLNRLWQGVFVAAVTTVFFAATALAFPYLSGDTVLDRVSHFGAYYYCRLKTTFHGPADFSTFVCVTIPVLMFFTHQSPSKWARGLAFTALTLIPVVLVAGSSRAARIATLLTLVMLGCRREFRMVVLFVGVIALPLFLATLGYRCVTDIVQTMSPAQAERPQLQGGYIQPSEFFVDAHRRQMLANFGKFLEGQAFATSSDMWPLARLLFGAGAGLSAYDVFKMGTHSAYIDLVIDKGLVGVGLFAFIVTMIALRLAAAWSSCRSEDRLRLFALVVMSVPLAAASTVTDTHLWLFPWLVLGLVAAEAGIPSRVRAPLWFLPQTTLVASQSGVEPKPQRRPPPW